MTKEKDTFTSNFSILPKKKIYYQIKSNLIKIENNEHIKVNSIIQNHPNTHFPYF